MDISKPLKANISFAKLDQIKQFLKKLRQKNGYEAQEENVSATDSDPNKDDTYTSQCCKNKISNSEDHSYGGEKASPQENLWMSISCCQQFSIHTTQIMVSVETCPNPFKPCLLVSLSNLSGNLNVKVNCKNKGKNVEVIFVHDNGILTTVQVSLDLQPQMGLELSSLCKVIIK